MRWLLFLIAILVLPVEARTITGGVSNERGYIGVKTCDRVVERVWLDSPAWHAGIRKGDKIVLVDGAAKREIIGEPYEVVHLCIHRKANGLLEVLNLDVSRLPHSQIRLKHETYLRDH